MTDYRKMFGEKIAQGLGLERSEAETERIIREYREDPAAAFTRMAALREPPSRPISDQLYEEVSPEQAPVSDEDQ